MPNRILRDWTDSGAFDGLSAEAERLFVRLLMKVDDFGRYHARPQLVKSACFPLAEDLRANTVAAWLTELSDRQLVFSYTSGTGSFLAIRKFRQRARSEVSKFPPPDGHPADWMPPDDGHMTVIRPSHDGHPRSETETETETETKAGAETESPPAREASAIVPDKADAIAQTGNAGILPDFAGFVFDDWSSRSGKDAAGNVVPWLPYVTKRWAREGVEWRNGRHRGQQRGVRPAVKHTPDTWK